MKSNRMTSRLRTMFRSRRGSMLIMVIVILVLLALIGTAMISTSRIDRLATAQNSINTQVDLLLESAKNIAKAAIIQDMYGAAGSVKTYRSGTGYDDFDAIGLSVADGGPGGDSHLASRLPAIDPVDNVYWPFITKWLTGSSFESPYKPSAAPSPTYTLREGLIASPFPVTINGVDYPTLRDPGAAFGYVGGDADGDGIPDSGLVRFPIGEINGVTYYYAVRIIDNNSAINASTAWYSLGDFDTTATQALTTNYGFFPSNIGLAEFLADYNPSATTAAALSPNLVNFNLYRFNNTAAAPTGAEPVDSDTTVASGNPQKTRSDFGWSTQGEAFTTQSTRRIDNPGYVTPTAKFRPVPFSDQIALAYRFCVMNEAASPSTIESLATGLPRSLSASTALPVAERNTSVRSRPYAANQVSQWYLDNFAFQTPGRPLRSLLVTRNPVQNTAMSNDVALVPGMPAAVPGAENLVRKVSINTAGFAELWRGFWNVMAEPGLKIPNLGDFVTPAWEANMFRTMVRDPVAPTTPVDTLPYTQLLVRAAMAAVNTIDLRDNDYTVTSRQIAIGNHYNDAPGTTAAAEVTVFGYEPQPYITEVHANTDTMSGQNLKGYVAIELHNPYPFEISLANWQLAVVNRNRTPGAVPQRHVQKLTHFAGFPSGATAPVILPGDYLVLENYSASPTDANDAKARPPEVATAMSALPASKIFYVPSLYEVFSDPAVAATPAGVPSGGELVLLRPRQAELTGNRLESTDYTSAADFNEGTIAAPNLHELVPVDSFDFSNATLAPAGGTAFMALHYSRQSGPANFWKFVYPGTYDVAVTAPNLRHEGMTVASGRVIQWDTASATPPTPPNNNVWDPMSATPTTPPEVITLGTLDPGSSYNNLIPPIQMGNTDWAGPNKTADTGNQFPFGQFARNGDMLQIPYFGAYRARASGSAAGVLLEFNSVTMDASLARDGTPGNDADEMLGRFCPLAAVNPGTATPAYVGAADKYAWAEDLFNYFTVWSPADDYFPNVDPNLSDVTTPAAPSAYRYPSLERPVAVKNGSLPAADLTDADSANDNSEDNLPVHGLININTAGWQVLRAVPWVPKPAGQPFSDAIVVDPVTMVVSDGSNGINDNEDIARLIVAYRDGKGPWDAASTPTPLGGPHVFRSIYDLNHIVYPADTNKRFQTGFGAFTTADPDDEQGDITPQNDPPATPNPDGVVDDFEEKFLMVNRVSNLITTRSDSFTVYVLVQGWKNPGTQDPELVATRRAAFIVDRSTMTATSSTIDVTNVPTD